MRPAWLLLAVVVTTGCMQPPLIRAFTASPTEVAYKPNKVVLSWSVQAAETVSITQLGRVATEGSAELSVEETTDFELTAWNGAGRASERVHVAAVSVSVSVRAVTLRGEPVAGARVLLDGKPVGETDAAGALSAPVLPAYQLTLVSADDAAIVHYGNLAATAVTATQFNGSPLPQGSATITGQIVGTAVDSAYRAIWISNGREVDGLVNADGTFSITVALAEGHAATGDVVAIRSDPLGAQMPATWLAIGRAQNVTITAGSQTAGVMVTAMVPAPQTAEVDVDPGALSPLLLGLVLDFGDQKHLTIGMGPMAPGISNLTVPVVSGASPALWGLFENGQGGRYTAYAPGVAAGATAQLHVGELPQPVEPVAGATLNRSGTIRWSGGAGLCRVEILPTVSGNPAVQVLGLAEVPAAALLAERVGMGAGTYSWRVHCLDRYAAPDELVSEVWPSVVLSNIAVSPTTTFQYVP